MIARGCLPLFLVALLLVPTNVSAQPAFYETVLVVDEPDDFPQGALDIKGLFVKEVYPYDSIEGKGRDLVVIRLEPRSLPDSSQCFVAAAQVSQQVCSIRYDIHFEVAGHPHSQFVKFGPQGSAPRCCPIEESSGAVAFNQSSVLFLLDRVDVGLVPGAAITKLYATSAFVRGDQTQKGDRAPGNNDNLPYDQRPEISNEFAPPYQVRGTFPFFDVEVLDGLVRNSVGGQQVKFSFKIKPTSGVVDDTIRVRFDTPEGWSITPSRGTTGADPTGLITGISAGMAVAFDVSASANDIVNEGDLAPIGVHFHSASEGHVFMIATVRVTGSYIEDADYAFQVRDSGPFEAGSTATLRFSILDDALEPRAGLPVDAVFSKANRRVATVPAEPKGESYEATYTFPSPGTWNVILALRGPTPAPHTAFTVEVEGQGGAPGIGLPVTLGLLALAALASRRNP